MTWIALAIDRADAMMAFTAAAFADTAGSGQFTDAAAVAHGLEAIPGV